MSGIPRASALTGRPAQHWIRAPAAVCVLKVSPRSDRLRVVLPIAIFVLASCGGDTIGPPKLPPADQFTTVTYQQGTRLFIRNATTTDTVQIGLETTWGGSIVEVSLNGTNYVNAHDTGREVQPAFYDGNAQYCCGTYGWDPVLGGDEHDQGTPISASSVTPNSIETTAQSLEWHPDDKGGGVGHPVAGDVAVEQTITPVTGHFRTFKAHYKITHLGTDSHANARQEFPAVYVNVDYDRFLYYAGSTPWTNGSISELQFPAFGAPVILHYAPERWGALVNAQNVGLTVYGPSLYPYFVGFSFPGPPGPTGDGTNYFGPYTTLTIGPGFVWQGDLYLIAGHYEAARQVIYDLHSAISAPDIFTPIGVIDAPASGGAISGVVDVSGWAFDDASVAKVEISVDGLVVGTASYGIARPDVAAEYPNAPTNVGYSYSLDTSKLSNGPHVLNVLVTDTSGNVALIPDVHVVVSN